MLIPLLLLISFPFILAVDPNDKPLFTKEDYKRIERFASRPLEFVPELNCPCGYDKLHKMELAKFHWDNPEKNERQFARYLISEQLVDDGGIGKIQHATLISYPANKPHKCVAIKMIKEDVENKKQAEDIIKSEIEVVESFRLTNHIIGYGPRHYYIMPNEEENEAIVMQIGEIFWEYWNKEFKKYEDSEKMMLEILKQILIGINEIHQKGFVHLDLKTANIVKMPSKDEIYLKLIDFGSALKLENGETKTVDSEDLIITEQFTAPEINVPKIYKRADAGHIIQTITFSKKADIWSFGMIILDLLSYIPKFGKEADSLKQIFIYATPEKNENLRNFNDRLNKKFKKELETFLPKLKNDYKTVSNILKNCLIWKPNKRHTAEKLLKDHFKDIKIGETSKKDDFFGEIAKYLEEQFNQISLKLEEGSNKRRHHSFGNIPTPIEENSPEPFSRRTKSDMDQLVKMKQLKHRKSGASISSLNIHSEGENESEIQSLVGNVESSAEIQGYVDDAASTSKELSSLHSMELKQMKKRIAARKSFCGFPFSTGVLKNGGKFCRNFLMGPAYYAKKLDDKAKNGSSRN